jgi:hypothetical protein
MKIIHLTLVSLAFVFCFSPKVYSITTGTLPNPNENKDQGLVKCHNPKDSTVDLCTVTVQRFEKGEYKGFLKQIQIQKNGLDLTINFHETKHPTLTENNKTKTLKTSWSTKKPGFLCINNTTSTICLNTVEESEETAALPLH